MGSLETRLTALEQLLPQGCATCRDWNPAQFSIHFEDADGTERRPPRSPRPEVCPDCGRAVPLGHCILIRTRRDGPQ